MKSIRSKRCLVALSATLGVAGCASALPPQDLVQARDAYSRASNGPAEQLNPKDLHLAKTQLDVAEASFADDGDTQHTRDQAYLAVRKIELAEVVARTMQADRAEERTVSAMHAAQGKAVARTAAELGRTQADLAAQSVAFESEKARREEAEKRAKEAAATLAKFATVKQEARGTVITLSGSVLFASGEWDLLPMALVKLNDVADALVKEDPLSKIVIEGHTDSQGTPELNQGLSQKRAEKVRDYLVTRGIASDRISAQGFGATRPIAENTSPEGRANNRRVEIVIQPASQAPTSTSSLSRSTP